MVGAVEDPDLVGQAFGRIVARRQFEAIQAARRREGRRRPAVGGRGQ
jgi:hypothetical protein